MLDTIRSVTTPEGVLLELRLAGPPVRMLAWLMDTFFRSVIYGVVSIPLAILGQFGTGVFFLILFVGEWGYPVFYEVWRNGATPGKKMFHLQVLHDDGTPVGLAASMIRNLVRFADFLPGAYGLGLLWMSFHPEFKRLGDLAAGTVVTYKAESPSAARIPATEAIRPPVPLALDEARSVVEYAARLETWTDSRALELSTLASPLTEATGTKSRQRLVAFANWLVGQR